MRWIEAVKEWNAKHNSGKYCVPRKGSKEHAEVMEMMGKKVEPASPPAKSPPAKMYSKEELLAQKEHVSRLAIAKSKLKKVTAVKRIVKALRKHISKKKSPLETLVDTIRNMMDEKKTTKEIKTVYDAAVPKLRVWAAENLPSGALSEALDELIDEVSEYTRTTKKSDWKEAKDKMISEANEWISKQKNQITMEEFMKQWESKIDALADKLSIIEGDYGYGSEWKEELEFDLAIREHNKTHKPLKQKRDLTKSLDDMTIEELRALVRKYNKGGHSSKVKHFMKSSEKGLREFIKKLRENGKDI